MAPLVALLLLSAASAASAASIADAGGGIGGSNNEFYISAAVSQRGLEYAKDILVYQTLETLAPLRLPDLHKSFRIPFLGGVGVSITNLTLDYINVSSSTVRTGDTGVVIVASGASANLSLDWRYSYSTWLVPIEISDSGSAAVQVEGMEVGLTIGLRSQHGTLVLNLTQFGCYMKDIFINLDGGSSWFYQGFINAFEDQIRSSVENAITKKIVDGISKLNSLLQTLPKKFNVDDTVSLNVSLVNDPLFGNSYMEFDINGLFLPSYGVAVPNHLSMNSQFLSPCEGSLKMLGISLDQTVFNSLSGVYFQAGKMQWTVDKVPNQSLLNTAYWKYIVPQLYRKYPNDDMELLISLASSPVIEIAQQEIGASIFSDMTVNILDSGETVSVACISVVATISGSAEISGNNLVGKADLNDFTLELKWSNVGNFHMYLIQGVMRLLLNTVVMPYVNSHLNKGFPLPIVHGFTLQNSYIVFSDSKMAVCSDVAFTNHTSAVSFPLQYKAQFGMIAPT